MCYSPNGDDIVTVALTHNSGKRGKKNAKADFKRAGLRI